MSFSHQATQVCVFLRGQPPKFISSLGCLSEYVQLRVPSGVRRLVHMVAKSLSPSSFVTFFFPTHHKVLFVSASESTIPTIPTDQPELRLNNIMLRFAVKNQIGTAKLLECVGVWTFQSVVMKSYSAICPRQMLL